MYRRAPMARRLRDFTLGHSRLPLVLLAVLSVLSFAARIAWIGEPCKQPCNTPNDHLLIFDEAYYVNAARVIDGINPRPAITTRAIRSVTIQTPSIRSSRSS